MNSLALNQIQQQLSDCILEVDGGVALLRFDRDDVLNALTGTDIVDDVVTLCQWLDQQQDIQVLVLTGNGRAFSAGGNIKDMAERKNDFAGSAAEVAEKYRRGIQRLPLALAELKIPSIAAVNGAAVGAGFDIISMCDLAVASTRAQMGETFINLGIIPGDGGAWHLPRKIGPQKAAALALTGRVFDAHEALELGLLLEVCEPEELLSTAMELAREIASKPALALRQTKRLLHLSAQMELKEFLDLCAEIQGLCHQQDEHLQAVNALLEKLQQKK